MGTPASLEGKPADGATVGGCLIGSALARELAGRGASVMLIERAASTRHIRRVPLLGPSSLPGLLLATGHFRNGILLAPVTALALADELSG